VAKSVDVVKMLRPEGGWIVRGNEYEGIEFIECESFTKKEWQDEKLNAKQFLIVWV